MEPAVYERWLSECSPDQPWRKAVGGFFGIWVAAGCPYGKFGGARAAVLRDVYGKPVPLQNGEGGVADDGYLRD